MAPAPRFLTTLLTSRGGESSEAFNNDLQTRATDLVKRATSTFTPGQGSSPPEAFHNAGILALFALIGTGMVVASIWFFFWAKNGGFHFRAGDWEDYKSTVLRRKGPDGRTLSNATKSTRLGGGTIAGTQHYAWAKHQARSVVSRDEKGRKGILGKRGWGKTHSVTYSDDLLTRSGGTETVTDEMTELRSEPDHNHHSKRYRDRDVTNYKKEKPARVGGLNRAAEGGTHFDATSSERSDLLTDAMTETSEQPILPKKQQANRGRAERKAREEAKKMERRWKAEAEAAAAALAKENLRGPPAPTHTTPPRVTTTTTTTRMSAVPRAVTPSAQRQRQRSQSRSASPRKRDFSYTPGPESETLYSSTEGTRTASYYDAYRPQRTAEPPKRQGSPKKKAGGGYRRGGGDSDFE